MAVLTFVAGCVVAAVSPPAHAAGDGLTIDDPSLLKTSTRLLNDVVADGGEPGGADSASVPG